jgi:lipopolysaccharide assembly outer membrane protein LptD (OstA)
MNHYTKKLENKNHIEILDEICNEVAVSAGNFCDKFNYTGLDRIHSTNSYTVGAYSVIIKYLLLELSEKSKAV